nr:hypothetical protein Iba_chr12cCG11210 [Ipomoea batatas]
MLLPRTEERNGEVGAVNMLRCCLTEGEGGRGRTAGLCRLLRMPEQSFVFVANGEDRLCRWTAKLAAARCFVARREVAMAGPAADHGLAGKKKVSDVCCRSWRRLSLKSLLVPQCCCVVGRTIVTAQGRTPLTSSLTTSTGGWRLGGAWSESHGGLLARSSIPGGLSRARSLQLGYCDFLPFPGGWSGAWSLQLSYCDFLPFQAAGVEPGAFNSTIVLLAGHKLLHVCSHPKKKAIDIRIESLARDIPLPNIRFQEWLQLIPQGGCAIQLHEEAAAPVHPLQNVANPVYADDDLNAQ